MSRFSNSGNTRNIFFLVFSTLLVLSVGLPGAFAAPDLFPKHQDYESEAKKAQKLLGELVAADTTNPPGNEQRAVEIGAAHLKAADIPFQIVEFAPGRQNLVARLKAGAARSSGRAGEKPILILAHVDVVSAAGQAWSSQPHQLLDTGNYLQGRGVGDDLGFAATALQTLILLKNSGAQLRRDVILAWTGDEEAGGGGLQYILKNYPELVQAEFALNEGGGVRASEEGKAQLVALQVAEKIYQDVELVAKGQTGHASVPHGENSIQHLSAAIHKLSQNQPPARLLSVTREYFAQRSKVEEPLLATAMKALSQSKGALPQSALQIVERNPSLSALLRTTCTPTLLTAGNGPNALPAQAKANLNCRLLPDENTDQLQERLKKTIQDPLVEVKLGRKFGRAEPSPLDGPVALSIEKVIHQLWPGIPIIPTMSTGATDSRYLRAAGIPTYGLSPIPISEGDAMRFHGVDERIPKTSLKIGLEFYYRLILALAGEPPAPPPGPRVAA